MLNSEVKGPYKVNKELEDYDITNAGDGEEALKRTRADKPDIILLDVQMPVINGYDVCGLVKTDPAHLISKC